MKRTDEEWREWLGALHGETFHRGWPDSTKSYTLNDDGGISRCVSSVELNAVRAEALKEAAAWLRTSERLKLLDLYSQPYVMQWADRIERDEMEE